MIRSTTTLTLSTADAIANAAISSASNNLREPAFIAVTVLDASGSILVQKRMDNCPASGAYTSFSYSKAKTCIHLGYCSRAFREKYTHSSDPSKFTQASSMVNVMNGELIPVAGGVLVRSTLDGSVVGAVGVSGAAADEDEYLAIEGVRVACNSLSDSDDSSLLITTDPSTHLCTTLKE